MALGESIINGLHPILLTEINLCQLMSSILLWLTLCGASGLYIGSFTVSTYKSLALCN